ncbi:unnamed protein product [Closterium sp. Yama58-4]|nr:unnamed protein product [Closterium sp. Yama58-4]
MHHSSPGQLASPPILKSRLSLPSHLRVASPLRSHCCGNLCRAPLLPLSLTLTLLPIPSLPLPLPSLPLPLPSLPLPLPSLPLPLPSLPLPTYVQVLTDASAAPANSLLLPASSPSPLSHVWRAPSDLTTMETAIVLSTPIPIPRLYCYPHVLPSPTHAAPSDLTAVEIAIILSTPALVSRVVLHSGLPQYTPHHTPKVRISLSTTIDQSERTTIGLWDLPSSAAAALSDAKSNPHSELILSYTLPAAAAPCRIIWLKFLLPEVRQLGAAASSIWARRIRVYGQKTFGDPTGIDPVTSSGAASVPMGAVVGGAPAAAVGTMGPAGAGGAAAGGTSRWEYQQFLEAPAPMSRSRTPVEGERVWAGGRILELLLPVSSPPISGIRLDALPLDRSAGMFLSLPGAANGGPLARAARGGLMDEWGAFVVPFRLRVSARQDSFGPATVITESILPAARPNTPLYFDFSRPIAGIRILSVELIGDLYSSKEDLTTTTTTPSSSSSSSSPSPALGTTTAAAPGADIEVSLGPLSLAGRVRAYRYAPAGDMAGWSQLAGV